MPITINGSGTVTGISAGGLPDDCIVTADIADNNVTTAKIANIGVTEIKIADGAVSQAKRSEDLTLETAKSATGTSVDFTSIPSWVKRVTVMFDGVSTNGASNCLVQIGAGSVTTSGYISTGNAYTNAVNTVGASSTAGFLIFFNNATNTIYGAMTLTLVSGNTWGSAHSVSQNTITVGTGGGGVTLSGTLDRVRVTSGNGTDTFDAGLINIMYE